MRSWLSMYSIFVCCLSWAQVTLTTSDLPIIKINTNNQTILDDPRIVAEMEILDDPSGTNNVNNSADLTTQITIEIRGSTSQQYPKKNYGFSTISPLGVDTDMSLLDLPPENDWILYGPYPDKTLIRNVLTFKLWREMGHYASNTRYCELLINDEYKGIYILMEKIKRDDARINVTPLDSNATNGIELTGGYLFKVDKTTGTTVETFTSNYNPEVLFQYHDPGPDELNLQQKTYLQNFVFDFEDMLAGPNFGDVQTGYHSWIDKTSFYDFFIMEEVGRTVDGYRSSSFLYKDRADIDDKIHAGPIWDFNLSYGNADYCNADQITGWQYEFDNVCPWFTSSVPFWWGKLLTDSTYANGLKCRWEHLRSGPLHTDNLNQFIDSVSLRLEDARIRNFQQWPIIGVYVNWNGYVGNTYQEDVDYLKWYLENRIAWMDANLPGTCWPEMLTSKPIETDIQLKTWPNPASDFIYISFQLKSEGETRFALFNMEGQPVYESSEFVQEGNYIKSIPIQDLAKGVYNLTITSSSGVVTKQRIIKA